MKPSTIQAALALSLCVGALPAQTFCQQKSSVQARMPQLPIRQLLTRKQSSLPAGPYVKEVPAVWKAQPIEPEAMTHKEPAAAEAEPIVRQSVPVVEEPAVPDVSAPPLEHTCVSEYNGQDDEASAALDAKIQRIRALEASIVLVPDPEPVHQEISSRLVEIEQIQNALAAQITLLQTEHDTLPAPGEAPFETPVIESEPAVCVSETGLENAPIEDSIEQPEYAADASVSLAQPSAPAAEIPAAVACSDRMAELDTQIEALNSQLTALEAEKAALLAQMEANPDPKEETPPAEDEFTVADNVHELNLQLDEIERVYYLLVSGAITGDKASELLETYQARLNACAKKADEFARVNVYRLYNPNSGEHHYTLSETERTYLAQAGWKDEGVGWKAPARQQQLPVYRLYNPNAGDHHYTTGIEERTFLIEAGWQDEGISWYSDTASQGLAIYRLYNPNAKTGSHHYTDSERENQALAAMGWQAEGISWYGLFPYSILWQSDGDKEGWVAYDNDTDQQVTGRITIAGTGYYYKPQDGYRLSGFGTAADPDNPERTITIYADDEGRIQTGWVAFDEGSRYFKPSSWEMITGFYQTDRGFCHFQESGLLTTQSFSNGPARITIDSQGIITKTELNVGYLAQNDPRWKNRWIGGWQFGGTGCVPTVLTMIINTLTNAAYLPTQVGEQIHQAGYFNTDDFGTTAEAIPYTASLYGLKLAASLSLSLAAQVLQQGGMLCAAMDPGLFCSPGFTHEIVVFGYENGKVRVFDPYWPEHNGIYDLSIIFTQKSTNKDDIRAGGPIFGWMLQGR